MENIVAGGIVKEVHFSESNLSFVRSVLKKRCRGSCTSQLEKFTLQGSLNVYCYMANANKIHRR